MKTWQWKRINIDNRPVYPAFSVHAYGIGLEYQNSSMSSSYLGSDIQFPQRNAIFLELLNSSHFDSEVKWNDTESSEDFIQLPKGWGWSEEGKALDGRKMEETLKPKCSRFSWLVTSRIQHVDMAVSGKGWRVLPRARGKDWTICHFGVPGLLPHLCRDQSSIRLRSGTWHLKAEIWKPKSRGRYTCHCNPVHGQRQRARHWNGSKGRFGRRSQTLWTIARGSDRLRSPKKFV